MNQTAAAIFKKYTDSGKPFRVKLLGDSITHGVGGTGFDQDGEPIAGGYARNPHGFCWANLFRDHMKEAYDCTVINNGCTSTGIEFVIEHFDTLVEEADDIILCTIGTNNRNQFFNQGPKRTSEEHQAIFYQNILKLQGMFKETGKDVILFANIPAALANEKDGADFWRLFHMWDVNALYKKAAEECGFLLISLYDLMSAYLEERGMVIDPLLVDGLHPSDEGYKVMYDLICKELGV